jgi:putative ABC transport system ATP-binding protein
LLKIIASLLSPTSGKFSSTVKISRLVAGNLSPAGLYCAQTPALFGDSVYDNLIFPWQIRNNAGSGGAGGRSAALWSAGEYAGKIINELSGGKSSASR